MNKDICKTEDKRFVSSSADAFTSGQNMGTLQLQGELHDAKKEYFKATILWNSIMFTITDHKVPVTKEQQEENESGARKIFATLAMRNFPLSENKDFNLLGISKKNFDLHLSRMQNTTTFPNSSVKIRSFHSQIVSSLKPYNELFKTDRNNYIIIDKKFVEKKKNDVQNVLDIEMRMSRNIGLIKEQVVVYFSELLQAINYLQKLTETLIRKLECKSDVSKYVYCRCRALDYKVEILKLEVINATYNSEVVKCHKNIKSNLTDKIEEIKAQILHSEENLKSYEILGRSYEAVVNEYTEIRRKIKREEWAINELQKKN